MPSPEVLLAGAVLIVALGAVLFGLGRVGWVEFRGPFGFLAKKDTSAASLPDRGPEVRAARIALEQFGEVAGALAYVARAEPTLVEPTAREWFTTLATRLATRLKEERDHHYRVAIWLDDESYPDRFICIGHGLFNRGDTDMDSLDRAYTIGGLAFSSPNMQYYCRDIATDPNFRPRKNVPPSFKSVFGLALGTPDDRWGVMTVDARQANGFPEEAQWLIREFGDLASLGAVIWASRVGAT